MSIERYIVIRSDQEKALSTLVLSNKFVYAFKFVNFNMAHKSLHVHRPHNVGL